MPLIRESSLCDPENLDGVRFVMLNGKSRVLCKVTYGALCNRAAVDGNGNNWLAAWKRWETRIEQLASLKYDAGAFNDGWIIIRSEELNAAR